MDLITSVSINTNFIVLVIIILLILITLFISLRSQGIYKSIIGISGVFIIAFGLLIKDFIEENALFGSSIIIITILSYMAIIAGLGMIYIAIANMLKDN